MHRNVTPRRNKGDKNNHEEDVKNYNTRDTDENDEDDSWYTDPIVFDVDAYPENSDWLKTPANLPKIDSPEWNSLISFMGLTREEALNLPVYKREREKRDLRQKDMIKPDELEENRDWLRNMRNNGAGAKNVNRGSGKEKGKTKS